MGDFLFECEEDGCICFEVQGNVAVGDRAFGDGRKRTFFAEKGDFFLCQLTAKTFPFGKSIGIGMRAVNKIDRDFFADRILGEKPFSIR